MIKVCHISTVHNAFDGRIFHKQCCSLVDAGYDVSLVVTHPKNETVNGVKIIGMSPPKNRLHRIFIKTWEAFFKALKTKSKIYHFHDPELMFTGVLLRLSGKKVIFDSHENVAAQIESKKWLGNTLMRKIVKSIYRGIEKFNILFFNKVVSVTPEIVEYLSPKKGVLIRNYPILNVIENIKSNEKNSNETTLIYVGGLTRIRGIKETCVALQNINKKDIKLLLLGPWESESYKKECLDSYNNISYLGVKPLKEVYPVMKSADIGLAVLYPEKNYLKSLPIKAFEYMMCGLPMVMSNFPYWKKTFNMCSKFVNPTSIDEIKNAIEWMVEHKEERIKMGLAGQKVVKEQYSWEAEAKTLIKMYDELSGKDK